MPTANPNSPASTRDTSTVRHWHISESFPGCIPEAEPRISDSVDVAIDEFAHMIASYAEVLDGQDDGHGGGRNGDSSESSDAAYAQAMSETCCTCAPRDGRSDMYGDLLARTERGGLTEIIANRCFEITPCDETDCLKYCPAPSCGTVTAITDVDTRCWACGARYVDAEHRPVQ